MKIALLGPNGQLGTDIRASQKRHSTAEVIAIDRQKLDLADIENATELLRTLDYDVLINCTGYHKTDEVEKNAGLAFTINAHAVRRLVEICAEKKARFVHISTDYVFGGQNKREPLVESDCRAP